MGPKKQAGPKTPANPVIGFEIPSELSISGNTCKLITIDVKNGDLNLTWLKFLEKHWPELIRKIGTIPEKFVIMDKRPRPVQKVWKLAHLVKQYINSFSRSQNKYTAKLQYNSISFNVEPLIEKHSNTSPSTRAQHQQTRATEPQPGPSRSAIISGSAPRSSKQINKTVNDQGHGTFKLPQVPPVSGVKRAGQKQGGPQAKVGKSAGEGIEISVRMNTSSNHRMRMNDLTPARPEVFLDSASMASSQDSLFSQEEADPNEEQIKVKVLQLFIEQVDNKWMLKMRNELQQYMNARKWLRFSEKFPAVAAALQLVFRLRSA